jgi:hypothetical protein
MSLNIPTGNQAAQPQPAAQVNQQVRPWNFGSGNSGGMFGVPIGRSIGSEIYNGLKAELTEIYKNANTGTEITLIDLDNQNQTALVYSSIVVVSRIKAYPKILAYHILTLEATGERPAPVLQYQGQKQIEIYRVAGDAVNSTLITIAKEAVSRAFPNCESRYTDATVVPNTFNVKDKGAVFKLAFSAIAANGTELSMQDPVFADLNVTQIPSGQQLVVNMSFDDTPVVDAVDSLMRSDFQLSFATQSRQNISQHDLNKGNKEERISDLSGFVEMLWAPAEPIVNPYAAPQQRAPQKFAARAVVTNINNNYAYTPGSLLLAVAMVDGLALNNNYYQIFRPRITKDLDLRDIGALNIEGNFDNNATGVSSVLDTKSSAFTTENMGLYLNTLVRPGLMVAIDCPEAGPQSWYTGLFTAAAGGSSSAYDIIYHAAEELTNGNFGKSFPRGAQMFIDNSNRIHLGHYTDRNGAQRDIRDIDYLAAANIIGANNVSNLRQFTETYLNTSISLAERLSDRKRMISSLTNETAVFTSYAQRVTFHAAFVDALRKGIAMCNVSVRINSAMSGADFNSQRGVASFANMGLMTPSQSFMGFGNTPQNMGNYMNMTGYRY